MSTTAPSELLQRWLIARTTTPDELIEEQPPQCPPEPRFPNPPRALKVWALGGGKVELRWASMLDHRVRFVIQRWTAAKGWADVASVPGHRTSYIDEHLTPYTTCAMRVLIESEAGRSNPSNVARAAVR
jgi:hypothetical protein